MAFFLYMEEKPAKTRRLGELLLEEGVITEKQLQTALDLQKKTGGLIGSILIQTKAITPLILIKYLAKGKVKAKLGELLVAIGKIRPEQLKNAMEYQNEHHEKQIGIILINMGYIGKSDLVQMLTLQSRLLTEDINALISEIDKSIK